tara:strand:+ start:16241 stop:16837 length:597 start_codon:yes stop_codon:yes gene_type:complete
MPDIQQAGVFRGEISSYGLNEADSGAIAVTIKVSIHEIFHEDKWHDWKEHDFVANGDIWVIKKDGKLNKRQAEALVKCAGWDGSFTSISQGTWSPTPVSVVVNEDTYKDETRFRIEWLNEFNRTPGGGNVDDDKAKNLEQKFGSELRAIAGNSSRNGSKPASKPSKSKKGGKKEEKPKSDSAPSPPEPDNIPDEEIPF